MHSRVELPLHDPELLAELEALRAQNSKLKRINAALIERVESSSSQRTESYAAFQHSVELAEQVRERVEANPLTRDTFIDWGEKASSYRLVLDQDRLRLLGFTPAQVKSQINALLSGWDRATDDATPRTHPPNLRRA